MILSYLPLKGLLAAMQVCRRWRGIISGAAPAPLWRNVAHEIGLSEAIVKTYLPECGSYMELTLMALRHRKCISSYVPNLVRAEEACRTFFEVDGAYVTSEELDSSTTRVKQMYNDGSLVTLHSFNSPDNLRVEIGPFAPITNRDFVFWGNGDTGWIGWSSTDPPSSLHPPPCKTPRTDHVSDLARIETDTGLHVWRTNEIEHCWPENLAVCPNCGLIAIFCLRVSNCKVPILFRKLTPGKSTVSEGEGTLQLPKNVSPDDIESTMMMFPKECEQGVCGCHYLLVRVMYEPDILFSLHLVPAELSCISELPSVRLPTEVANWTGALWPRVITPHICSSNDGSVVTYFVPNKKKIEEYHVWEPESGRVVSVCFLPNLNCHFWLATGKLYSILGGEREFAVIGTYTGVTLLHGVYKDYEILPPADQSWLSTFDTPEHLPIAILNQTYKTSAFIGSIIAQRSV